MAQRHVREGEAHVQKLRDQVDSLMSRSEDASGAKGLLRLGEDALAMHQTLLVEMLEQQAAGLRDEDGNWLSLR
ncbi:hypothetical protein FQV39_30455 (plasmid) [Bosea sp. F3-2]|uniref:hypothetical protein n=1 Tax=Bosea sp. F3-2 TaxID=2599640 RepID=UPI0011EEE532|nr:hypothetical protein [Bosea sp. F3-2]QEL26973.1 hypothetical protein FQV39_30455 [Bosea sp. F3-2]